MNTRNDSPLDDLAAFNQRLLEQVLKPLAREGASPATSEVIQSLTAGMAQDQQRWLEIQNRYYQKQLEIWTRFASAAPDAEPAKVVEPEPGDRRFRAPEWQQPYFSFLAQSYLLHAKWLSELIENVHLDPQSKRKLSFCARQYIDAM